MAKTYKEATVRQLKQKLVVANRILDFLKMATPFGHISVRIPNTDTFLIARSVAPGLVTMNDIVVCDMNEKVLGGRYKTTYAELAIHTGVYKKRKEFNSVIHSHSSYVIALSLAETTVLPTDVTSIVLGPQPIAVFEKVVFINKPELGREAADLLGPNKAVILKGHGALVVGRSVEDAIYVARNLENTAMLQLMALSAGKLVPLTDLEKQPLIEFNKWANRPGMAADREWTYYASMVKKVFGNRK